LACGVSCRPRVALLENGASASSPTQETRQTRTWSKSRLRRRYGLLPDSPLLGKLLGEPLELHGMNRMVFCKRINALSLCCAFLTAVVTPHCLGANKPTIAGEEIDQSVIAALPHQGATKPKVISHIDLTEPFGTVTQWTFVAVQEGGQPITEIEDHGPIHVCLVKASSPDCSENLYQQGAIVVRHAIPSLGQQRCVRRSESVKPPFVRTVVRCRRPQWELRNCHCSLPIRKRSRPVHSRVPEPYRTKQQRSHAPCWARPAAREHDRGLPYRECALHLLDRGVPGKRIGTVCPSSPLSWAHRLW